MTHYSYIALCATIILAIASAQTATTLTSAAFAVAPGKVFDSAVTADSTTWGAYNAAWFGPGTANTTVYVYGVKTSGSTITTVASRTLNATLLSNGTADTTLAASAGTTDAVYSTGITTLSSPTTAVGLGNLGVAYVALDTATIPCPQVYVSVFTGGTSAPTTKAITSNTCSHCTTSVAGTGTGYSLQVNGIIYDNKTFYVTYVSSKYVETETLSGAHTCSSSYPTSVGGSSITTGQVTAYVGAVTSAGALAWTAPAAIYTGSTSTAGTSESPMGYAIQALCGTSNYTNSTNLYCVYTNAASTAATWSYLTVTTAAGTAGTATTIATNVAPAASGATTQTTYSPAGFVHSQYQQGILLNQQVATYSSTYPTAGYTSTYVNTLTLYNLTSGATAVAGGVTLNITNTYSGGQYSGAGYPFSLGWGLTDVYQSASSTYSYELGAWFANGTTNTTKAAYASGTTAGQSNLFIDANGALWAGAYSVNPNTLTTGYVGKLVSQLYSTSTGNILVTFFGLISLVVAVLFVF
jgi:hypothetical protein